jgi:hypothetical protein
MRNALAILFLFAASAVAQVIPTQQQNILINSSSYGPSPYLLWERYANSYYADVYTQWTNQVYDVGQSGFEFENDWKLNWEKWVMPYMAIAPTPVEVWLMPTDNGAYLSNDVVQWGTNIAAAPPIWWNGTGATNEGISFPSVSYYFLGGITADSADQSSPSSRQAGSTFLNALYGHSDFPLFLQLSNNGVIADQAGARIFGYYAGSHPFPAGHLAMSTFTLLNRNVETNIASFTLNFDAGTFTTNHCVVSGVTATASKVSWTIHYDRMPPGYDYPDGIHTNDATKIFTLIPSLANAFNWTVKATNLPSGTYVYKNDGVMIFTATSAQLAAGVNQYTITNGWLGAQRYAVLDAICDVNGDDPVTLAQAHTAGELGVHGVGDDINYRSQGNNAYTTLGLRGSALVTQMTPWVGAMRTNQSFVWAAAQQTNHTASLELVSLGYASNLNVGTLTIYP